MREEAAFAFIFLCFVFGSFLTSLSLEYCGFSFMYWSTSRIAIFVIGRISSSLCIESVDMKCCALLNDMKGPLCLLNWKYPPAFTPA